MATKQDELAEAALGKGCLGRSQNDEPIFILVARDRLAAEAVRDWARRLLDIRTRTNSFDETAKTKWAEAMNLADRMDAWRERHGGGKVPD